MTPADYAAFVWAQSTHTDKPLAARLGLLAEAGEVAGLFERALRAGQPAVDPEQLALELGDVLFYAALDAPYWSGEVLIIEAAWTRRTKPELLDPEATMERLFMGRFDSVMAVRTFAASIGLTLQDVATRNVEKLRRRNAEKSVDDRSRRTG